MMAGHLFTLPVMKDTLLLFKNWLHVVQIWKPRTMMERRPFTWPACGDTLLLFKNWLPVVQTCLSQQQMKKLRSTWHANLIGVILWTTSSMPTQTKYLGAKAFKQSIPSYNLPHFRTWQLTHDKDKHFHSSCNCRLES